jgi:hypothetical protein
MKPAKPLGRKLYGSIGHLPGSRLGPGDHHVHEGQAIICTKKVRDKRDVVIVQEKLDGSNCGVALLDGKLIPLNRRGYPAITSPFEQHKIFHQWVFCNEDRFRYVLREGERIVGEWLAQAHGTRYALPHEPFVVFDIMEGDRRISYDELLSRVKGIFITPALLSYDGPLPVEAAMEKVSVRIGDTYGYHGALDPVEGVVYRVERDGSVDFLAKYVRPDKVDGRYLPEVSGEEPVWNWRPDW